MANKITRKVGAGATGVRSPSSRARNVSHVTNKDSDKDLPRSQLTGTANKERTATKSRKNEQKVREKTTSKKKVKPSEIQVIAYRNQNSSEANSRRGQSIATATVAQP